jgi:hypothetical protein
MCEKNSHPKRGRRGRFLKRWLDGAKSATYIFFTSDDPLPERVVKVPLNLLRRVTQLSTCCGNYGEPGC